MGVFRFFLAFAVLQSHVRSFILLPNGIHVNNNSLSLGVNGGYAVVFFFIVSGFLISFVLEEKYNRVGGTREFYLARFIRIYPLWWSLWIFSAIAFGYATGRIFVFSAEGRSVLGLVSSFFLFGSDLVVSFSNYPKSNSYVYPSGLGLGWSLATEVTFYAMAPFLLRSNKLCICVLVASGLLREIANIRWPLGQVDTETWNAWCYYFFPSTIMFFLLGHLGRKLYQQIPMPRWMGFAGLGTALLVCRIQDATYHFENVNLYFAAILIAGSLPAIFEATKDNGPSNFLGDLTYPLYLTHSILILYMSLPTSALYPVMEWIVSHAKYARSAFVQELLVSAAFAAIAATVALVTRFAVEVPATKAARFLLTRYPPFPGIKRGNKLWAPGQP